jgi:hypothetical protein
MSYQTTFYWRKNKDDIPEKSTKLDKELIEKNKQKAEEITNQFDIDSFALNAKVQKDMSWKEEQNVKLQDRQRMIQTNVNPFLSQNYLQDLDTQKEFLMPKDSNIKE